MKKAYYLFCLIIAVFATSCAMEENNLFDDSSAKRADAAIETTIDLLTGASNGWLMEYFPESTQKYGGYNVLLSFNKEGVTSVASEIGDPSDVVTSLYMVKQSAGIVLSFDSYNPIFHYFSDPSDPSGAGGKGKGMEGDYDFLIIEASAEKIILKGKKAGGYAILTPMVDQWSNFISVIQDADNAMFYRRFEIDLNGDTISVSKSRRTLIFNYKEDGDNKSQTASYIVTETGYKFYSPITVKGITFHGFIFDSENEWFTETVDSSIKLIPIIPPLNEQFVDGDWYIANSTFGTYGKLNISLCRLLYYNSLGETLNFAYIGSSLYGSFGLNFDSSGYKGLLGLDYTLIDEDQISLVFNFSGQGNGVWYHNNAGFSYLLNPFGYSSARTFTLTTDNIVNPTYITLSDNSLSSNVITLHKAQILYPFSN